MAQDYTIKVTVDVSELESKLLEVAKKVSPVFGGKFAGDIKKVQESVGKFGGGKKGGDDERIRNGILNMASKIGMVVTGVFAGVELAKQALNFLRKTSGILDAVLKVIEVSVMLMIKPIADFVGYLLKPIVILFYRYVVLPFYRTMMPFVDRFGRWWNSLFEGGGGVDLVTTLFGILGIDLSKEKGKGGKWLDENVFKPLESFFKDVSNSIGNSWFVKNTWMWISDNVFKPLDNFFKNIVGVINGNWFVKNTWVWINDNIFKPIDNFFKSIVNAISENWFVKNTWKWIEDNIIKPIDNFFKGIVNAISENWYVKNTWNWVQSNVIDPIVNGVKWLINQIESGLRSIGINVGGGQAKVSQSSSPPASQTIPPHITNPWALTSSGSSGGTSGGGTKVQSTTGGGSGGLSILGQQTGTQVSAQSWVVGNTLVTWNPSTGQMTYKQVSSKQTGGIIPYTGLYMLHAGEYVVSKGRVGEQIVNIYPKIEIGSLNILGAGDLRRFEDAVNRAIAEAIRRRM